MSKDECSRCGSLHLPPEAQKLINDNLFELMDDGTVTSAGQSEDELEKLLDYLYERGYDSGDGMGMNKYPKDVAIIETQAKIERLMDKQREQARQEAKQNGKVNEANRNLMMIKRFVAQWRQGDIPDPEQLLKDAGNRVMKLKRLSTAPKEENKNE